VLLALLDNGKDAIRVAEPDQASVGRLSRMHALQGQSMSRARYLQPMLQRIAAARVSSQHAYSCRPLWDFRDREV
jgi:hypothetical protein